MLHSNGQIDSYRKGQALLSDADAISTGLKWELLVYLRAVINHRSVTQPSTTSCTIGSHYKELVITKSNVGMLSEERLNASSFNNLYSITTTLYNHRPDQSALKPIKMFHWFQRIMERGL